MRAARSESDWGFLFLANRPILDFLNTRPVLAEGPTELLPDVPALEQWLIASGIVHSAKARTAVRSWRHSPEAASFLKDLIAFRERLREAIVRLEAGSPPSDNFLEEVNRGLLRYAPATRLRKRDGRIVREPVLELNQPQDLWGMIFDATASLLAEPQTQRLRQCESCVLHFFDTSKKGSRRWCSMNLCGNKLKVAAWQRRQRDRS